MGGLVAALAVLAAVGGITWLWFGPSEWRTALDRWRRAGAALDLFGGPARWPALPALSAPPGDDGLTVRLEGRFRSRGRSRSTIVLSGGGLRSGFTLRSRGPLSLGGPGDGRPPFATGDPDFDAWVWVTGDEAEARTYLDAPTRRAVLSLSRMTAARLHGGRLEITFDTALDDVDRLRASLEHVQAVARRLRGDRHVDTARLADLVVSDPEPEVRARSLHLLGTRYGGTADLRLAVVRALADADDEVRRTALRHFRGRDVSPLLRLVDATDELPELRAEALGILVAAAHPQLVAPRVTAWLHDRRALRADPVFALAVIDAAACLRLVEAADALARTLLTLQPVWAAAAAGLITRLPYDAGVEDALMQLLERDQETVVRSAAAALGGVGRVRAITPLHAAAARWRRSVETRRVAEDAITAIHHRAGSPEEGGLTVSPEPGGEMTLLRDDYQNDNQG